MPAGILTVIDGDTATITVLDPNRRGEVAGLLLDAAGPRGVEHVTAGPTGSAFLVSKDAAEAAGLVDKPAAPAKKTGTKKAAAATVPEVEV